jgi:hypothetical protein
MRYLLLIFSVVGLLAGCRTASTASGRPGPYVKPGLIMLTADQADARGINLTSAKEPEGPPLPKDLQPLDSSAVLIPGGIKVYTVNRYPDVGDRDILHEEHVIYRKEAAPRWRLDAPQGQKIMVGPRLTDGRQEIQPVLTKELDMYLAEQRRLTDTNQQAITALAQAVEALGRQQQKLIKASATASAKAEEAKETGKETTGPEADGKNK